MEQCSNFKWHASHKRQGGMSLIEMMIGLTIGLLGMLAVSQVFVNFNQHRKLATSTMEAQGNGALAQFVISRDLNQAGYGLMEVTPNCSTINWAFGDDVLMTVQPPISTMPVRLLGNGAAGDLIEVQYGKALSAVPLTTIDFGQAAYANSFDTVGTTGFFKGDLLIGQRNNVCTLVQVTNVTAAVAGCSGECIEHNQAEPVPNHAEYSGMVFNVAADPNGVTEGWETLIANDPLVNLGVFSGKRYSVLANQLSLAQFPTYTDSPLVDRIIYLKAEYGLDTDNNKAVDSWVGSAATGVTVTNVNFSPDPAINGNRRVLAIRFGLVAQGIQADAGNTTTSIEVLPATTGGGAVTFAVPDSKYSYKAYYTIVPLRNVLWAN